MPYLGNSESLPLGVISRPWSSTPRLGIVWLFDCESTFPSI
jgi:hypothetical protein